MSKIKSSSQWQVLDARWVDTEPDCDVICVAVQGGGDVYAITCSGPKGMKPREFITALRAGTAAMLRASGGDMSEVGAKALDDTDPTFDTGTQRPS